MFQSESVGKEVGSPRKPPVSSGRAPGVSRATRPLGGDIFLTFNPSTAQDAIIALQMFLREARPGIRIFARSEQLLAEGALADGESIVRRAVMECKALVFFITEGVFQSAECIQQLRWAVEYEKRIVFVRETDARHGGVEMNAIDGQAPDDVQMVLQRCPIIPWYREKGFRSVSVGMVLRQAKLVDTEALEARKTHRTITELEALFEQDEQPGTVAGLVRGCPVSLKLALFLGGFAQLRRGICQLSYLLVFHLFFLVALAVRCSFVARREVPSASLPVEVVSAYLHVATWHAWVAWRYCLRSAGFEELLAKATASDERREALGDALRLGGRALLSVQLVMVSAALAGFALPATLRDSGGASAIALWVVGPPMVCSLSASYALFGLAAVLHRLDAQAVQDILPRCLGALTAYYRAPPPVPSRAKTRWTAALRRESRPGLQQWQQWQQRAAHEEDLFQKVVQLLVGLVGGMQARADHTSASIGGVWAHLFLVATLQIFAVSSSFALILAAAPEVLWWFAFQLTFHAVTGVVMVVLVTGALCSVTAAVCRVPLQAQQLLAQAGCPVSRQAGVLSLLGAITVGMHIFAGCFRIDARKATAAIMVIVAVVVNHAWNTLGAISLAT